ncbi:NAD(P)H-dependent oxidoreductase [Microbacterium excoecariae]|uniref:NAD(P)H-dependent oxidoreductase n=1 Tax=Microbacterium excoecariae TaxID=2715210 RepID=UPI0014098434|nr:NAD(P)H-dependent oxidoreductase [Microbacterium excoecariae]NHI16699.1 NAD(P)H-dependent oxidoreductase [Microbacterium excoecariae]
MPALVIDGHPDPDSFTSALARRYADAHGDARVVAVRDLDFDPVLRRGYRGSQPLEPDLSSALDAFLAADHLAVATPLWWSSTPALLKGFFDRILVPKVTYRYRPNGLPEGLLPAATGRILLTADSPGWYLAATGDAGVAQLRRHTMRFCGVDRVRVTRFTRVRRSDAARREAWLDRAARAGAADARSSAGAARTGASAPLVVPGA